MSVLGSALSRRQPGSDLGRHAFGLAALAFGVVTLIWHDYNGWHRLAYVVYAVGIAQIFGGVAIQFHRTAKAGAVVLGAVFLAFALLCVPRIVAAPRIYDSWGNFFEQFSLATGAAIIYARSASVLAPERLERIARIVFGACVASFTLEQAFYLTNTASLVPRWLPPSQMFWAVMTTVAFALAVVAIVTNLTALLATRLLAAMIALFGLVVWIPLLLAGPHSYANWSETVETFAIAGAAWILADLLGSGRRDERRQR